MDQRVMIPVHPIAALFPMMPDDELAALAEDIKTNGLRQPLVLDPDGQLLDGRNRLAACEAAGVEPRFETYDGDPIAFIWSLNDRRRHMNKGQRAMVAAMADPDGHQGRQQPHALVHEVGLTWLSRARVVLHYAKELAPQVRDADMSLSDAYEVARRNKDATESAETVSARLRDEAPDLASLVAEDQLKLSEALAAAEQRRIEALAVSRAATANLERVYSSLNPLDATPADYAQTMFGKVDLKFWPDDSEPLSVDGIKQCAAVLTAAAKLLKRRISHGT